MTSSDAAQWQPWGDVGENGNLYVGYYDRRFGECETTGCNDISLAGSGNGDKWSERRITTGSMPNVPCDANPFQCGFAGDYMSIQFADGFVHLVWADTRGRNVGVPEADTYYARVPAGLARRWFPLGGSGSPAPRSGLSPEGARPRTRR